MKLGIILQTNKPEHVWNGLRMAITALKANHTVKIFLLSEGVEIVAMEDAGHFDVASKLKEFADMKGELLACGTCLKIRQEIKEGLCPINTMNDLVKLVEESDKVLTIS